MAPVTQYVFAEMLGISEHFTAGSHEWLPYSAISTFPKQICIQQFAVQLIKVDNLNWCLSKKCCHCEPVRKLAWQSPG